jgi:DNA-binding response OmpR family regulator
MNSSDKASPWRYLMAVLPYLRPARRLWLRAGGTNNVSRILVCQNSQSTAPPLESALANRGFELVLSLDLDTAVKLDNAPSFEADDLTTVQLILIDVTCGREALSYCQAFQRLFPLMPRILMVAKESIVSAECQRLTCGNVLQMPFTARRVVNRVIKLLEHRQGSLLRVGDLTFNLQTRCVHRNNQVTRLTPKQAALLQVFMEHEGQTLTRKELMATVWNTDYMGDTRTLDVHVRWLREKIEEDPSHPRYLRTVRGIGYRFGAPLAE